MLDRQEEEAKVGAEKSPDAPTCADCAADATGGAYAPDRVGVLLCRDCHPDPDNGRNPAGGAGVVALPDGGIILDEDDDDSDEESDIIIAGNGAEIMTDGGRNVVPSARQEINARASSAADEFDASLLADRVHVTVEEDDNLRQVVDVAERACNIERNQNQRDPIRSTASDAAELLDDEIDQVVEDVVGKECVCLLAHYQNGWFDRSDHHDEETVQEAVDEALSWVQDHDGVIDRTGLAVPEVDR